MKKKVIQYAIDISVALIATIIIAVFTNVSFITMIDNITWMTIVLLTYMIVDDPINLALNAPKLITKPYLVGLSLFLGSLISFEVAYFTANTTLELVLLITSGLILINGIVWVYKNYRDPSYIALEIERAHLNELRLKIPNISKEDCEIALHNTLRFRIEGDNIEGDIDVLRPLDPENISTVNQMVKRNADMQMVVESKNYIKNLVNKIYG